MNRKQHNRYCINNQHEIKLRMSLLHQSDLNKCTKSYITRKNTNLQNTYKECQSVSLVLFRGKIRYYLSKSLQLHEIILASKHWSNSKWSREQIKRQTTTNYKSSFGNGDVPRTGHIDGMS